MTKKTFITLLLLLFSMGKLVAVTPTEALEKGKAKIVAAKNLSASFTMQVNGRNVTGKIQQKGKKFSIESGESSNWYNGTDLYTYLPAKGETTVFRPTTEDLAQVNPLVYIQSTSNYKITGTKNPKAGVETVVLVPKKSGTGVKSVTIELDSKTYLPKAIKLLPQTGGPVTVTISGVKLNGNIADSSFEYPKARYPKAKIIDMR